MNKEEVFDAIECHLKLLNYVDERPAFIIDSLTAIREKTDVIDQFGSSVSLQEYKKTLLELAGKIVFDIIELDKRDIIPPIKFPDPLFPPYWVPKVWESPSVVSPLDVMYNASTPCINDTSSLSDAIKNISNKFFTSNEISVSQDE